MPGTRASNVLLELIPIDARRDLHAEVITGRIGDELHSVGETPEFVYFPNDDVVISIVRATDQGVMVEAGVIGAEGLLSLHSVITTPAPLGSMSIVQIAGELTRVPTQLVRKHFQNEPCFREGVLAFTSSYLDQITQNTVCNRLHPIEQRLAKWLLAVRDRVSTNELELTHDFLSHMLGIHRPGVSIAVQALEVDGVITHARSRITIRDREGLMERTCECYAVGRTNLNALRAKLAQAD